MTSLFKINVLKIESDIQLTRLLSYGLIALNHSSLDEITVELFKN